MNRWQSVREALQPPTEVPYFEAFVNTKRNSARVASARDVEASDRVAMSGNLDEIGSSVCLGDASPRAVATMHRLTILTEEIDQVTTA